jgi:threonine dehydratase
MVDHVVLVSVEEMLRSIRQLAVEVHVIAEPAGAAATAVVMQGKVKLGREVVVLVTGANVTPEVLKNALCGGR